MNNLVCLSLWQLSKRQRRIGKGKGVMKALVKGLLRNECYKPQTVEQAREILSAVCPDKHSSAICENKILPPEADLMIIMPVYKVERYLEKAIRSVLEQETRYSFRLVIVNDGSPDNSSAIIKRYEGDSRVKVIDKENGGVASARNLALSEISARYITFVDSDDALPQGAIEALMERTVSCNADISTGNFVWVYKNGRRKYSQIHQRDCHNNPIPLPTFAWGKVFKAELFERMHFPDYWYEDTFYMFLIYPLADSMATVSDFTYEYLVNPNGYSHVDWKAKRRVEAVYLVEQVLKDAETVRGGVIYSELQKKRYVYERFLSNLRVVFSRTLFLGEEVRRAVFTVNLHLFKTYFADMTTDNVYLKHFEQSLRNKDYKAYLLACFTA
ncbi:MAG: glycosyltransferase family 2 protein [Bacteroides sp.]|nr:glycosyltransferase family 2 protein [Ruminococcus flavefaciens]MCM1554539.1 glycosyltransferase family 2 protein [Bacteroides sp.]